jgi:hypothetical protein
MALSLFRAAAHLLRASKWPPIDQRVGYSSETSSFRTQVAVRCFRVVIEWNVKADVAGPFRDFAKLAPKNLVTRSLAPVSIRVMDSKDLTRERLECVEVMKRVAD